MKRITKLILVALLTVFASGVAGAGTITVDGTPTTYSSPITTALTYSNKTSVVVEGCTFDGGRLAFTNVDTVTVEYCDFANVTANGVIGANGCDLIEISNCGFSEITGAAIVMPNTGSLSPSTKNLQVIIDGVTIDGKPGHAGENIEDENGENGVDGMNLWQCEDLTITNCTIENCVWGIKVGNVNATYGYVHALEISNNYIHHVTADGILCAEDVDNAVVSNNEICFIAVDGTGDRSGFGDHGIYWEGPGALICDNYVHDIIDGEQTPQGGCAISCRTNVDVKRNIVHTTKDMDGIIYFSDHPGSGTMEISNNVVYDCARHCLWLEGANPGYLNFNHPNPDRYEVDVHHIYHNTFYTDNPTTGNPQDKAPMGWMLLNQPCSIYVTGNVVALNNTDNQVADNYIWNGAPRGDEYVLFTWYHWHGQGDDVYLNDNLLTPLNDQSLSNTFVDYANGDFHLNASSQGVNLVSDNVVTDDVEGHTRPGGASGNYNDAGAYEYGYSPTVLYYGPNGERSYPPEADPNAPTLSAISPTSGSTAGGTACTLTGTNFISGATVSFGGSAATNPVVVSSTSITCSSPSGSAGAVNVTVTTSEGTSGSQSFTYVPPAPTLTVISPTSGTTAGGTACTLTGTNLTGCSAVTFGSAGAIGLSADSSTQVRCTSPAGSVGTVNVTATTAGGTSGPVNYTYQNIGTTTTLYAAADSFVRSDSTGTNYGSSTFFQVQYNNVTDKQAYLKFNLSTIPAGSTITSAKLSCYLQATYPATSTTVLAFSASTDSWAESTIKWSGRPALGSLLATTTGILTGSTRYEWDITTYAVGEFAGDKIVTVILRDDVKRNIQTTWSSLNYTGTDQDPYLLVVWQ